MSKLAWVIVIGVAILVILGLVSSLLVPFGYGGGFGGYGWGMGPWMMGPGMMGGFGGFGFPFMGGIWMILFWVLIIGGVVWLVQSLARGTGSNAPQSESFLETLKRRYAKGEITKEQFEQMKHDLGV
jgi:putative membrane protein